MPKSRKRKNKSTTCQVIPIQVKKPVGTKLVDDPDNPGKKIHQTVYAVFKSTVTKTVRHRPQPR